MLYSYLHLGQTTCVSFMFSNQNVTLTSFLFHAYYMSSLSNNLLVRADTIWQEVQMVNLLIMQVFPDSDNFVSVRYT
jgi:hypothetical protein